MGLSAPNVIIATQYYGNMNTFLNNPGVSFASSMSAFDENLKVPSIYNWSLGIQQGIGFGTVLDVAYVGNTNRHIEATTDLNTVPYEPLPSPERRLHHRAALSQTRFFGPIRSILH